MKTIVLTGGGTAGHVTPHLAILNDLKKNFISIYYIGSCGGIEKDIAEKADLPFFSVETVKLRRKFCKQNFSLPFGLLKGISQSKFILKKLKPDVVFSKGGYVALPVVIAANKLKIPVIIHESDLTVGLANKIASRFAQATLTSFEETAKAVPRGIYTGSPLRENIFTENRNLSAEKLGVSLDKPVLLITGGSSGAMAINNIVLQSLDILLKKYNVLHLTGKNNLSNIRKKGYTQIEFADMKYVYSVTDIAVSRCGSNTAFELFQNCTPTLFIPLPKNESRGDQILNAEYFYKKGICDYILQENLNPTIFVEKIDALYLSRRKIIDAINKNKLKCGNKKIVEIIKKYSSY